jgi:DNA-binding response OmpR family regulator
LVLKAAIRHTLCAIRSGAGARRLLVVDDEPALAMMAGQALRHAGHDVTVVHAAEAAIALLTDQAFDVLVTDLGLGDGMDGWQLVSQARAIRPQLRIVMVSGWAAHITPALAAENGVDALVSKPFRLATLTEAVEGPSRADSPAQAS